MDRYINICRNSDSSVSFVSCGKDARILIPNTVDANPEKHLPFVTIKGNEIVVKVGSKDHPMYPEHFIEWIYLDTVKDGQRIFLHPGDNPQVTFTIRNDRIRAVYAYCNLHGLWMTKIKIARPIMLDNLSNLNI